jgi:hypothetical protein
MKGRRRYLTSTLLAVVALATLFTVAQATNGNPINKGSQAKYTVAVIGDMPYGDEKVAAFPEFIDFMNKDKKLDLVAHVGDIKNGSSLCTDEYFEDVREQLDRLKDPVVFTPGDNEWTDCHRANNGNYKPTERLAQLRSEFFPVAGETIGGRGKHVLTQANDPAHSDYVENVMWMESKVVFATFNQQGSNNDSEATNPWTGAWAGDPDQAAERAARDAANLDWLTETFATAEANGAKGVVLLFQADMWDAALTHAQLDAHDVFVQAIGDAAIEFDQPVLMVVGDSHEFKLDNPYDGSAAYQAQHPGFTPVAPNITRIIVEGATTVPDTFEYLRLTIDPGKKASQLFSWERVAYEFE